MEHLAQVTQIGSWTMAFLVYTNESVQGWSGLWNLYYFTKMGEAYTYASRFPGARITETTQGSIWRVSIPLNVSA